MQVKYLNLEQRLTLARLIVAINEGNKEKVVEVYTDMGE